MSSREAKLASKDQVALHPIAAIIYPISIIPKAIL
jgi:hypothetical protein